MMRVSCDRELELARDRRRSPGAIARDDRGREPDAEQAERADDDGERVHDQVREPPRRGLAVALELLREGGDEGGRERALGEQVAQQVRDAEGGDEGVELAAGAEEDGEHLLADEAEDAARQDAGADDAGAARELRAAAALRPRRQRCRRRRALLLLHRGLAVDT